MLAEDRKKPKRDYRTILTFLSRMEKKGFLAVDKEGNTNFYTPVRPKRRGLEGEIARFLKDVVGPEPEDLELVRRAVEKKLGRRGGKGPRGR